MLDSANKNLYNISRPSIRVLERGDIMLTNRQIAIFKTIVEEFVNTAEPVGSKTLMELLAFSCSSATIRNEMAILEDDGLLEKTHTSSGRIPSSKGYRYYVENLMDHGLDENIKSSLQQIFYERHYSKEEVVKQTCDILAQMTNLTTVALGPESRNQTLKQIQMVPIDKRSAVAIFVTDQGYTENRMFRFNQDISAKDIEICSDLLNKELIGVSLQAVVDKIRELEPFLAAHIARHEILLEAFVGAFMKFANDRIYYSGKNNMLYQPEFSDIEKLKEVMQLLENNQIFREIENHKDHVEISVGKENTLIQMDNVSIVSGTFKVDENSEGKLMVVGPSRMPYRKVVSLMKYMTNVIENIYKEEDNDER